MEMEYLLNAFKHHSATARMGISPSKTKVTSALMLREQRQIALFGGTPMQDAEKFKYLGSMIRLLSPAILTILSHRETLLRTKGRVNQAVVRSIRGQYEQPAKLC